MFQSSETIGGTCCFCVMCYFIQIFKCRCTRPNTGVYSYMKDKTSASSPQFEIIPSKYQTMDWRANELGRLRMSDERYQKELFFSITGIRIDVLARDPRPRTRINRDTFEIEQSAIDEVHTMHLDVTPNNMYVNFRLLCLELSETSGKSIVSPSQFIYLRIIRDLIRAQIGVNINRLSNYKEPIMFFNILDGDLCHRYNKVKEDEMSFPAQFSQANVNPIIERFFGEVNPSSQRTILSEICRSIFIGDMSEFKEHWDSDYKTSVPNFPGI